MGPKQYNKAYISFLSSSGQSQLHFGTKFILMAYTAKIRLNFAGGSRKLTFLQKYTKTDP